MAFSEVSDYDMNNCYVCKIVWETEKKTDIFGHTFYLTDLFLSFFATLMYFTIFFPC